MPLFDRMAYENARIIYQTLFPLQEIRLLYQMLNEGLSPSSPIHPQKPASPECSNFIFSIKNTSLSSSLTVSVDFQPLHQGEGAESEPGAGGQTYKSFPVFNDDRHFFTPSFMLHYDKVRTPQNLQGFWNLHQNRLMETVEEREELWVAKPSKNNSFCCICRTYFEDYLEHVVRADHKELLQRNKFGKDMLSLCARFGKEKILHRAGKQKKINKGKAKQRRNVVGKQLIRSVSTEVSSFDMGNQAEIRS